MPLTAQDVEEILRYLDASPFDELHLEMDGLTLHLRRTANGIDIVEDAATGMAGTAPATSAKPAAPKAQAAAPAPAASAEPASGLAEIRSTFLGTFYRAPKPGEAPFTDIGARVDEDSVVCIVEVMKLMNSLRAGVAGEVIEVCAKDGELVEYGQVLFRVKADA